MFLEYELTKYDSFRATTHFSSPKEESFREKRSQ